MVAYPLCNTVESCSSLEKVALQVGSYFEKSIDELLNGSLYLIALSVVVFSTIYILDKIKVKNERK